jgi:predicted TIM-barrel fold metal-dependent hydrolase
MNGLTGRRRLVSRCGCYGPTSAPAGARLDRRDFLAGGVAAVGAGLVGAGITKSPASAQGAAKPRRIDVHHHIVPPAHAQALASHRSTNPIKWSATMSLEDMDRAGIATSIVSILNPGVWFGKIDAESRSLARTCNEYAANLEREHPGRFRSFAVIPLPDTEGSLGEIEYSLDVLKAEGIALYSNYSGKYLGEPAFRPVFEELSRRKAMVYTHPTGSTCCTGMIKGVSEGTVETGTETTRTVASLIFGEGGTALRFPDIRWIWPHSGGTVPFLTSRFVQQTKVKPDPRMPDGPLPILQKFYYDVAQGNTPGQLAALMKMVAASQVMFGSDYPFRAGNEAVDGLADFKFSDADLRAIESENALKMFPRLRA